ncbi:hypothetical protein [Anaerorhabdus furcosa]|uniref:Lipoprotein n=1 Tax=Anaerorhabdus furcosa TaxID=118967 RepID=A0A1T4NK24_9FIRM|nr:hypothetical protein [Anaerorhabdus furcosa]SJZ79661.1 hypothetical protein SAMN02745191_1675 [Anaerorhabdus furcosa]
MRYKILFLLMFVLLVGCNEKVTTDFSKTISFINNDESKRFKVVEEITEANVTIKSDEIMSDSDIEIYFDMNDCQVKESKCTVALQYRFLNKNTKNVSVAIEPKLINLEIIE